MRIMLDTNILISIIIFNSTKLKQMLIDICDKYNLEYKAMIRYVDDTMIVFKNKNKLTNKEIFKELSKLEQELSLFLNNELMIRINEKKTEYTVIHDKDSRKEFIEKNTKKVSNVANEEKENTRSEEIEKKINEMIEVVKNFNLKYNIVDPKTKKNLKWFLIKMLKII